MTSHKRPPAPIEKLINNLAQSIHGSLTSASATEFIALAVDAYNGHRGDRPADDRDTLGGNFARVNGTTGARFSQPSAARGRQFSRGGIIDEIVPVDNPPEQLGGQMPHARRCRCDVSPDVAAVTSAGRGQLASDDRTTQLAKAMAKASNPNVRDMDETWLSLPAFTRESFESAAAAALDFLASVGNLAAEGES